MSQTHWYLFIISLPGDTATVRMRLWRSLKSHGAGILRDGVYLFPAHDDIRDLLRMHAGHVDTAGGVSYLLEYAANDQYLQTTFVSLFDRTDAYEGWLSSVETFVRELQTMAESVARRKEAKLRREFESLTRTDYFPNEAQTRAAGALKELGAAVNQKFSIDEPSSQSGVIEPLSRKDFVGRNWATRKNLWVDRLASAWLIKRFIDPKSAFIWLEHLADCPEDAIGFDFDGATFTHVDDLVTFEVLIRAFQLDKDTALEKISAIVHYLDVGGLPVSEADGLVAMLSGIKQQYSNDDDMFAAGQPLFDHLYSAYA